MGVTDEEDTYSFTLKLPLGQNPPSLKRGQIVKINNAVISGEYGLKRVSGDLEVSF